MIATSSTYLIPYITLVPPYIYILYTETNGALKSKNKISEISEPYRIPVGVGKISKRYPRSLIRVNLPIRNEAIYSIK